MRTVRIVAVGLALALLSPLGSSAQQAAPKNLDQLLEVVRKGASQDRAVNRQREQEFTQKKAEQGRLLSQAQNAKAAEERRSEELEKAYGANEVAIANLEDQLRNRMGELGELFGVVRQVAGDTQGILAASLVSAQHPGRVKELDKLAQSKALPSIDQLEGLWYALQKEMTETGKVARFGATVVTPGGDQAKQEVIRIGPFSAIADGKYLNYQSETSQLVVLGRQPAPRHLRGASRLSSADPGEVVAASIDPSRGSILGLLVQTPSFLERIQQGGQIGYITMFLALVGLIMVAERLAVLGAVGSKMKRQVSSAKASTDNPLGRILAIHEQNPDADPETLQLKLDEGILKEIPKLERFMTGIKVISVVAPLLGLLGTVTGMIQTFQSITLFGAGDPKLMASGISTALVTTMIGLFTAIPMVLLHSIVRGRANGLIQTLDEQAAGLIAERAEKQEAGARGTAV